MAQSFYIIDGHAQIFRAYFAPFRELSSPTGEPTKATYVFAQWLMNLVEQRKPDYLAMVIDTGDEQVFRKEILPEYKANRQPRPADLPVQEERILRIVRDAGVPIFSLPRFEADDLIATMVRKLCDLGHDVYIVSKDKDLRQLMGPCVRMYDIGSAKVFDQAALMAECGYTPQQAIDVQTLMGDSIDNVPGIPGVGEKTAVRLIAKYGTVAEVVAHAQELTPRLRQNLLENQHLLPLARQLVTLKDDVPMDFDPEQCRFEGLNADGLRAHLQELGFNSLLKKLADLSASRPAPEKLVFRSSLFDDGSAAALPAGGPATQKSEGCAYELIDTPAKLKALVKDLRRAGRFAFDTETDALGAMASNLIGMSFSWKAGAGCYVAVRGPGEHLSPEQALPILRPVLEDPKLRKIGHNIKYDLLVMRQAGVELRGIELDTMVAAFLLDASRTSYGIDALAMDLLNFRKVATSELIGKGRNQISMDRVPLQQVACYAAEDADIAWRLAELLGRRLDELPAIRKLCDELETPLIDVLAEMEHNGVAIDPAILKEQSQALGQRIEELRKEIAEAAGCDFNPDSPRQLGQVLFEKLGLRVVKRTKTGPSTDVEVLEKLALEHRCPRLILEYRSLVKLKNTYLDNLTDFVNPRTGRIHASFNQTGAATGRLSCSDPNLQNIPIRTDEGRRIRLAFVPFDRDRNVLLTADYSQIELRVLAHFTGEPGLVQAFEQDEDIHRAVAAEVFGVPLDKVTRTQRSQAKIINFGIIYGVSAYGLARRIDGLSVQAAQDLISAYAKRFPAVQAFLAQCVHQAQAQGYVETILGRRRPIPDIHSGVPAIRNGAERAAINSVVQGSAADLIKRAMLNVHRRLKQGQHPSRLVLQVHDELVFETPRAAAEQEAQVIRQEMVGAMQLRVPLKVDIGWGSNWQEGKS